MQVKLSDPEFEAVWLQFDHDGDGLIEWVDDYDCLLCIDLS